MEQESRLRSGCCCRSIYPTDGQALIFGKDVTKSGPEIRQNIGYLPSEVFYYDDMRVRDLLKYSASFYPGDHRERIAYLVDVMELEINRKIRDLSYGNKKKVGIVQGLLHNPPLLFLDEPTSGLDPLMQRKFFDLIREENKKGVTVFFSSHFLGEVQRICDRVGIIREGRMVEVSDIHTLQKSNYKKIRFISKGTELDLALPGMSNLQKEGDWTEFFYSGDINLVLARLGNLQLEDLSIEEPTLEEIFMHYYE